MLATQRQRGQASGSDAAAHAEAKAARPTLLAGPSDVPTRRREDGEPGAVARLTASACGRARLAPL